MTARATGCQGSMWKSPPGQYKPSGRRTTRPLFIAPSSCWLVARVEEGIRMMQRGALADVGAVRLQPAVRRRAAEIAQRLQELAVGVELARRVQHRQAFLVGDHVQTQVLVLP